MLGAGGMRGDDPESGSLDSHSRDRGTMYEQPLKPGSCSFFFTPWFEQVAG